MEIELFVQFSPPFANTFFVGNATKNPAKNIMAIRKSKEENFQISGNLSEVIQKCKTALEKGEFTKINVNETINQLTANYKKLSVWGEIKITLTENNERINVNAISTANSDNLFALFSSPNDKILNQFKNNL